MTLPMLEATVCLLRKSDTTLIIDYRNFPHPLHQGFFAPPGGKLKPLETKEEGAKREILEEIGIKVKNVVYRGEIFFDNEYRDFRGEKAKYNFRVYYFDSFDFDDSHAKATEGALLWVLNKDIQNLQMHEGDKMMWKWLNKHKEINGYMMQDSNSIIKADLISFRE